MGNAEELRKFRLHHTLNVKYCYDGHMLDKRSKHDTPIFYVISRNCCLTMHHVMLQPSGHLHVHTTWQKITLKQSKALRSVSKDFTWKQLLMLLSLIMFFMCSIVFIVQWARLQAKENEEGTIKRLMSLQPTLLLMGAIILI